MKLEGKCSQFGGSDDAGMVNDTGLSFFEEKEADACPELFRAAAYPGEPTWKRLRQDRFFIALNIPLGADRKWAQNSIWLATNPSNARSFRSCLVDRGPSAAHRVVDCSAGLLQALGAKTDDTLIIEEVLS